jgi:hypothetical protein
MLTAGEGRKREIKGEDDCHRISEVESEAKSRIFYLEIELG